MFMEYDCTEYLEEKKCFRVKSYEQKMWKLWWDYAYTDVYRARNSNNTSVWILCWA